MGTTVVTTDLINSPQAADYFTRADRRVMIGLRACLEMLSLPVPDYAHRRKPGQTPAKAALAAYNADHPMPRSTMMTERKADASPERLAEIRAERASVAGMAGNGLFSAVFPT